jgi:hypothetical protein
VTDAAALYGWRWAHFRAAQRANGHWTAGGFVYIAATDLLPELHKEPEGARSVVQVLSLLAGIGVMAALLLLE